MRNKPIIIGLASGSDLQLGGLPGANTAHQIGDILKLMQFEQAGGNGRAVAAGAVDNRGTVSRHLVEALGQVIEGDIV